MTSPLCSGLTLIVDHDVGFLMWLGEVFQELGCQAVPALHCRQALALVRRFELPVATLIVNPEMRGAERAVREITAANPDVRVVLICNSTVRQTVGRAAQTGGPRGRKASPGGIQARSRLRRPSPGEPISRAEWVEKVRRMLT